MKVYCAGPMTGLPAMNFPAFQAAAEALVNAGHIAVDPSTNGIHDGWTWSDYMRKALAMVVECDGVALLDGWTKSQGAEVEVFVADRLGLDVRPLKDWLE